MALFVYVTYSCPCFQFVAVAARDKGRAQDFADKLDFRKVYSSYDDVATDPDVGRYLNTIEPHHEKTCLCLMRTTKAQISLRIRAV